MASKYQYEVSYVGPNRKVTRVSAHRLARRGICSAKQKAEALYRREGDRDALVKVVKVPLDKTKHRGHTVATCQYSPVTGTIVCKRKSPKKGFTTIKRKNICR